MSDTLTEFWEVLTEGMTDAEKRVAGRIVRALAIFTAEMVNAAKADETDE